MTTRNPSVAPLQRTNFTRLGVWELVRFEPFPLENFFSSCCLALGEQLNRWPGENCDFTRQFEW